MAKVVKYCAACEEGFAEKFGFCPNCGDQLTAYEMNPLMGKTDTNTIGQVEEKVSAPVTQEVSPIVEKTPEPMMAAVTEKFSTDEDEILELEELPEEEEEAFVAAPTVAAVTAPLPAEAVSSFEKSYAAAPSAFSRAATASSNQTNYSDGNFHVTFVEEKNASGRNLLLLGAFLLVSTVAIGGVIYSLFQTNALVGSLSNDELLSFVSVEDTPTVEEVPPPPPKGKEGGGGGGGGKQEEAVRKGDPPSQMIAPKTPPTTHAFDGTESQPPPATKGPEDIKRVKPIGALVGDVTGGDGPGTGGGMGTGTGTGAGSGRGSGRGSGTGSGVGNGNGTGYGDGDGPGGGGEEPPKVPPKAPPQPLNIISRPRATYTDEARQNQVTGVVRVRVTFLASGQIGSVTPINSLPYGLTEKAIAAAKQIRFEPAKVNGVAQTVSKTIEYSFTIY